MNHFKGSLIFTVIGLLASAYLGYVMNGLAGALSLMFITLVLAVMEVSLSFDNAVVNAAILKDWDEYWRKLFLTVGIIIAVFGMRLVFPILIVAISANMGMIEAFNMALNNPEKYSSILNDHHIVISAFGGAFLFMVFLSFIFDSEKDTHWIWIEKYLAGNKILEWVLPTLITLVALLLVDYKLYGDTNSTSSFFMAGLYGLITFVVVGMLSNALEANADAVKTGSIGGFLYLEVLDASFSFDGVIGAFAITNNFLIIMIGLAIGAFFVRSLTVYLVEKGTLDEYIYLEHGAHYAIGVLGLIMITSGIIHVPEVVTGFIGILFIAIALFNSITHNKIFR